MLDRLPDLFQCNLRLRLEVDLFWNSCLASPLRIARPYLRQIQSPGNRQTRIPRTERQTHSHATVVLLTNLSTILARYSYRMTSFFRKPGVIDDPCHHRTVLLHCRQYLTTHLFQHHFIVPGCIRYQMMQGLMHSANIVRSQQRSHRLNALALTWQQQAHAVILQRNLPVTVSRGTRQALHIRRETLLLWAWRGEA